MESRDWHTYMVKAVFAENDDWPELSPEAIAAYHASLLPGWEAQFFKLPNPILTSPSLTDVLTLSLDGHECRIYPPFLLNERGHASGAYTDVRIPQGKDVVEDWSPVPSSAVRGVVSQAGTPDEYHFCTGLRLDVQSGFAVPKLLRALYDQIVQFTQQWWLRSPQSPFEGPLRLGAQLTKDFRTTDVLRYRGAGTVESTWYGGRQTQRPLGIERPVNRDIWLLCFSNLSRQTPAETGLLIFADALASYMAGEDERCILNLAICFEILASKRGLADRGRTSSKNKDLLRVSTLVDDGTRDVIRKLIIDRDHVAHGRAPFILGRDPSVQTEAYIDAIRGVVHKYLALIQPGEWPRLAQLRLESTRRR